jgi:hypothetical protein
VAAPVFVDLTGRRRRGVRLAAIIGASLLVGTVALLVAALLGAPIGPLTSLPEPAPPPAENVIAPNPEAPADGPGGSPTSTIRPRQAGGPAGAVTTTTVPSPVNPTTTTDPKGSKPASAPGRPTDLPTPPGHTR